MSQGGYAEIVGFVAREPNLRQITSGAWVANVRVGATTRYLDKTTGEWRESDTSYFTVICWRKLAHNVDMSLRKGDPVLVRGRIRTRSFTDKQNRLRTEIEIVADHIGHDLSRGTARYTRPERPRDQVEGELAEAPPSEDFLDESGPDDPGDDGVLAAAGSPAPVGPGTGMIDEGAVDDFNRLMSDDSAVARELADPEPEAALPF
jgi:single-strand DNA-binding protein